jgi:type IV pilus assembly protein PilC
MMNSSDPRHGRIYGGVRGLLSLFEPVMIVFLGVVVGGMIVAMHLPIFDMMNSVK